MLWWCHESPGEALANPHVMSWYILTPGSLLRWLRWLKKTKKALKPTHTRWFNGLEEMEMIWSFVGWWGLRTLGDVPRTWGRLGTYLYSGVMALGHLLACLPLIRSWSPWKWAYDLFPYGHLSLVLDKALEACGDISWLWTKVEHTLRPWRW